MSQYVGQLVSKSVRQFTDRLASIPTISNRTVLGTSSYANITNRQERLFSLVTGNWYIQGMYTFDPELITG